MKIKKATQEEFGEHVGLSQAAVSKLVRKDIVDLSKGLHESSGDYCVYLRNELAWQILAEAGDGTKNRKAKLSAFRTRCKDLHAAYAVEELLDELQAQIKKIFDKEGF